MNNGFIKIAAATPLVCVAEPQRNAAEVARMAAEADRRGVSLIVFPELCMTGYTCGDLLLQDRLLDEAERAVAALASATAGLGLVAVVGCPVRRGTSLYNCAVVLHGGKVAGIVPKQWVPNYGEFYEKRWFCTGYDVAGCEPLSFAGQETVFGNRLLFRTADVTFGVELCEDLWAPMPASTGLALGGAEVVANLSADNETLRKHAYLRSLLKVHSAQTLTAYVYASAGFGESTTDTVFAGKGLVCECGELVAESRRFQLEAAITYADIDIERVRSERRSNMTFGTAAGTARAGYVTIAIDAPNREPVVERRVNPLPFVPSADEADEVCGEAFEIQATALAKRLKQIGCRSVVIGVSGGLDSTLALLVCRKTFDKLGLPAEGITAVTMPGFGTTDRTYNNALALMRALGTTVREVSIKDACLGHFKDIGHDVTVHDTTYENAQARERTQILMDIANQTGGIVIGTGDLSELALGWATYNGDHMSMYGVNAGVTKTMVRAIVAHVASTASDKAVGAILMDIIDTPISPELLPGEGGNDVKQKTEDIVGPYELHDFFLYHILRHKSSPAKVLFLARLAFAGTYDEATIRRWLTTFIKRFFTQQFKRSCLPDGPKVDAVSLSPRGDWRMPSDVSSGAFISDLQQ